MKIVLVSREFPPDTHVGGIATYTAMAAQMLAAHGHEVHVLCNGSTTQSHRDGNLHVHRIAMGPHPLPGGRLFFCWRQYVRRKWPTYLDALTWAKTVACFAHKHRDLLAADAWEWPETNGEGAYLPLLEGWARPDAQAKPPVRICRIHTSWLPESAKDLMERFLLLRLQKKACALATSIVSPSQAMATDYARKVLRLKNPIMVSPNPMRGWPQPLNRSAKAMHHILFVGRIEFRKGVDVLLDALEILSDSLPEDSPRLQIRLVGAWHPPYIAEDGAVQAKVHEALAKPHAKFGLDYQGPCPHAELHQHLDWAGLLVMPTRMDNYPYVLIEAMTRGCCILASQVGGLPEICGGQPYAFWAQPGNPADLARKMREWLGQADAWQGFSHEAENDAKRRFGEEAGYHRLMDLYAGKATTDLRQEGLPPRQALA